MVIMDVFNRPPGMKMGVERIPRGKGVGRKGLATPPKCYGSCFYLSIMVLPKISSSEGLIFIWVLLLVNEYNKMIITQYGSNRVSHFRSKLFILMLKKCSRCR